MQVALEEANWLSAKGLLHLSHAAMAEIPTDTTVAIVVLLTELVKPLVNEGRNAALLGADQSMLGLRHGQTPNQRIASISSSVALRAFSASLPGISLSGK